MADHDITDNLRERVAEAMTTGATLRLVGGDSKSFYGCEVDPSATTLEIAGHRGITNYQPTELTLTARAGTPLSELRAALDDAGQMLPFEPPAFDGCDGALATLGGTVACGLSGPARPFNGACRDFLLGTRIINGRAQVLRFGGEVMKNVAGYDLSRLMVGALGSFGVILDASFKVLPKPAVTRSFSAACDLETALATMREKRMQYLPLTGASYVGERLHYRLAGATSSVNECAQIFHNDIAGEEDDGSHWQALREHTHPFFDDTRPLWRLALPPGTGPITVDSSSADQIVDWCGQQRWLLSDAPADIIQACARRAGGHATRFRRGDRNLFQDGEPSIQLLQTRLKAAFDPSGLFNPGKLAAGL